eukprot:8611541-Pyramimonas_sp.AAC.1
MRFPGAFDRRGRGRLTCNMGTGSPHGSASSCATAVANTYSTSSHSISSSSSECKRNTGKSRDTGKRSTGGNENSNCSTGNIYDDPYCY